LSGQTYHQKFIKLLKYVTDDKNHLKVHQFLVGLDSKIKTVVNVLNPKTLEQAYDLAKRAESNLGITKTLMNYAPNEKDKEPFQKNRGAEQQALHNSNRKINQNHKDGNFQRFEKKQPRKNHQHFKGQNQNHGNGNQGFRNLNPSFHEQRNNQYVPKDNNLELNKAPWDGCWNCSGAHYANQCPLKIDPPKDHRIFAATGSGQVRGQATPLQISGKISGKYFKVLIDYGATNSFISNSLVKDMIKAPEFLTNGWQVEFGSDQKCYIKQCFRNIKIELPKGFICGSFSFL